MKISKVVVAPGVNAVKCNSCKGGTVMVSVTMEMMAKMRCGKNLAVIGTCQNNHKQQVTLTAWPLFWSRHRYKLVRT